MDALIPKKGLDLPKLDNRPLHLSREYTVFGPNAYTEAL